MSRPLVYQITNTVSAQLQADCVALLGGTSIMSREISEAAEIAAAADSLLINIGTPEENAAELYRAAARAATEKGRPIVLDLVGFGFTKFRTEAAKKLLAEFHFAVIKGNEAEIAALCGVTAPRGVSCEGEIADVMDIVATCAKRYNCTVYSTGEHDHLSDGTKCKVVTGGSAMLSGTSGSGCALGSATALFCARETPFSAALRALSIFRESAQEAAKDAKGTYSFRIRFMDGLARRAPVYN